MWRWLTTTRSAESLGVTSWRCPVEPTQDSCQVLLCTTPAWGIRSRSRSAYASARSRTPVGLLPTVGADLMIALRTASRACSLRL